MRIPAVILALVSLLLTACNQTKPTSQIPVVGYAVDSAAIAQDTLQQKSIEQSYEYAQTVVVNPKLVYDVRAYGGPASHGEYCIIRRGADNKPDTVVQTKRKGIILKAFTADLNKNEKEEIYIVMREAHSGASCFVEAYEFTKEGKPTSIDFDSGDISINTAVPFDTLTKRDTIYVQGDRLVKNLVPPTKESEMDYEMKNTYFILHRTH
jgi:hypothetical protein